MTAILQLLKASEKSDPQIGAESWNKDETRLWILQTMAYNNYDPKNDTLTAYTNEDLNKAIDYWYYKFNLNGKKLKEYVIEPNIFMNDKIIWNKIGGINHEIINKFYINLLQLFVTFVIIDLISDNHTNNIDYNNSLLKIKNKSLNLNILEKCDILGKKLNALQRIQNKLLGYTRYKMLTIGSLYTIGLWSIKDINNSFKNQFLIVCSHIEIASNIVELFNYDRWVSASLFHFGKQKVYISKISHYFKDDTFSIFINKEIERSRIAKELTLQDINYKHAKNKIPNSFQKLLTPREGIKYVLLVKNGVLCGIFAKNLHV